MVRGHRLSDTKFRTYAYVMSDKTANTYLSTSAESDICADLVDYATLYANDKIHLLPKSFKNIMDNYCENNEGARVYIDSLFEDGAKLIGENEVSDPYAQLLFLAITIALRTGKSVMMIVENPTELFKKAPAIFEELIRKKLIPPVPPKQFTANFEIHDPVTTRSILVAGDQEFKEKLGI